MVVLTEVLGTGFTEVSARESQIEYLEEHDKVGKRKLWMDEV